MGVDPSHLSLAAFINGPNVQFQEVGGESNFCLKRCQLEISHGTSLVVQVSRLHLPMQGVH